VIAALVLGWTAALVCAVAVLAMRLRLERAADAEHELRGALTAFGLALEQLARTAPGQRVGAALESELARARSALGELSAAAASGRAAAPLERLVRSAASAWEPAARDRRIRVEWPAGAPLVARPAGRVAQALGNLVSNAVEHGGGDVRVRGRRSPDSVRIEVSNAPSYASSKGFPGQGRERASTNHPSVGSVGRGRGLRIAGRAARAAGGELDVRTAGGRVVAALELPVER
jgi:two-component system sensor histidine kinase MtrB